MKNIEIVSIVNAFTTNKDSVLKLPASIAWKRRVNFKKLIEAKNIIDEALKEISERYTDDEHSVEIEDGRRIKEEYMKDFVADQKEILEQDTEVDIRKVRIEDLGDVELSDADMDTLMFMIEEEE